MEYVGWKNVQSALRYVEGIDPFERLPAQEARPFDDNVVGLPPAPP